jgi:hypothetical protein
MYIKTFEDVRKFMVDKTHINFFVEWGYLGMFNPSARVDSALYILEKNNNQEKDAVFVKLNHLYETKRYDALFEAYEKFLAGGTHELLYTIPQAKLKVIKSWPFIYWISDEFRKKFKDLTLGEAHKVCAGLSTANNIRFCRFWWEINNDNYGKKWIPYAKGGPYNKWFGNIWLTVNWENNGSNVRNYGAIGTAVRNEKYYFKKGITNSLVSVKGISARFLPVGHIFDIGAPSVFIDEDKASVEYCLGFVNSKLIQYIANCFNPTANLTWGDFAKFPYINPTKKINENVKRLVEQNIKIKIFVQQYSLVEREYKSAFVSTFIVSNKLRNLFNNENYWMALMCLNEAKINEMVFEVYDLTEHDKAMVLAKEGESIGGLPVTSEARNAYLTETEATKEFSLDAIREFIEALPIKEFTAEERETIESGFGSLYQSNNDLEEFCIRHQVNPINVWYWFKQSNVIPQQRMHTLAMEFLADMVREILMEDEDGIIPLVPNAGEKVLLDRIEEKFREKGFSSAQYSSFDSVLGRPIHEYLNNVFFRELSDHLNLFMYLPKTPFIWHLSSGPEQGFDCYIIIYKWSRDKLMRMRSVYIEHRERSLVNRQSDLSGVETADAQNEKDRIFRQLKEIEAFKAKIDELLAEGYNPILDDGVGKNIAPLQKKKMIPYEVLNAGQLKKYLNADW